MSALVPAATTSKLLIGNIVFLPITPARHKSLLGSSAISPGSYFLLKGEIVQISESAAELAYRIDACTHHLETDDLYASEADARARLAELCEDPSIDTAHVPVLTRADLYR